MYWRMRTTTFHQHLERLLERFASLDDGSVADYIPELTKVDPDWFGIAIVTCDGHVYQVGDTRQPFSIQSISKAFTYGIALEDQGEELVASKINVEPSGEAFNSISLEPVSGRPLNPMINAGAIVATSLVNGESGDAKLLRIRDVFGKYAGRQLQVDEAIYLSEKATGHRNRAIAHLLRNYNILSEDPEEPLDAYFRQCSIMVNARDLAVMGATLANDGVNPITGVRALESDIVPSVLSVMATCGMYDYSGNWIYKVGMPAKSGVGGGIVAVLPGQLAVAVFSPLLDSKGNSVRGLAVCEALSREFGLHMLHVTRLTSASVIRAGYTGAMVRSNLNRDVISNAILEKEGEQIQVLELTGDLLFVSAEILASNIVDRMESSNYLILDLARVTTIDISASTLLAELMETLIGNGKKVIISGVDQHYHFVKHIGRIFKSYENTPTIMHADVDHALEYVEDLILKTRQPENDGSAEVPLKDQMLCKDFDDRELDLLQSLLKEETYAAGEIICQEGEPADKIYFLATGRISASVRLDHKRRHRLSASVAGWSFGESALFKGHIRTADIVADTSVRVYSIDPGVLHELTGSVATQVRMKLLSNLSELSLARLGHVNREIRILTR
jgi:glutaminase